jgi:catechol 2,3-dioxygenase-like lactoylglutathione lyase family enzyme
MSRLGYERYGAMGNDGGSMISPEVGRLDPEHCIGVHVTQLFSFPSGDPAELQDLTADEQAAMDVLMWFWENVGAFNVLQSQALQTIAHALADSPVGLLGWNSQLMLDQDDDFIIGNVATCWFTRTAGSAIRPYREDLLAQHRPAGPTTIPTVRPPSRRPSRRGATTCAPSAASPSATTPTSGCGACARVAATTPPITNRPPSWALCPAREVTRLGGDLGSEPSGIRNPCVRRTGQEWRSHGRMGAPSVEVMTSIHAITLEVADLTASQRFYSDAFGLDTHVRLRASDAPTSGFRGFTLSLTTSQPANVRALVRAAVDAGATVIKPVAKSFWGYGGVVQATDGTIWKVATSTKKDTGPGTKDFDELVLLLGVADVAASKRFYVDRGLDVGKSFGRKYVEFAIDANGVKLALYGRRALAKDAGVPADGTGSHRIAVNTDAGTFTDPDGFAFERTTD